MKHFYFLPIALISLFSFHSLSQNVTIVQADPAYPIDINNDATTDFFIDLEHVDTAIAAAPGLPPTNVSFEAAGIIVVGSNGVVGSVQAVASENIDKATKLNASTLVDASSNFVNGGSSVVTGVSLGTSALPIIGAVGEFPNSIEKYVGVKFDASGNTHYGWVKISLNTNCDTLILHGMGYQRTASTGGYTSIEESISFEKNISFSQSQDEISIYNSNSNKLNLTITSLNGEQVVNSSLNSTIKLNTSNFSKGIYVLTLSDGKNVYSKKFYLNN